MKLTSCTNVSNGLEARSTKSEFSCGMGILMFLIDPEGTVVYTVFKETDFTTNFTNGPYNESNLASAVKAARQAKGTGYVKIVDFKPYRRRFRTHWVLSCLGLQRNQAKVK
ncbi:MAG: hypothetical protein ACBR12_16945 [Microcoleus sp.]